MVWPETQDHSISVLRGEALFASALQRSDSPSAGQVRRVIAAVVHAFGRQGSAERVAQEFGDDPETAVIWMRWARAPVGGMFGDPAPAPGARAVVGATRFSSVPSARGRSRSLGRPGATALGSAIVSGLITHG